MGGELVRVVEPESATRALVPVQVQRRELVTLRGVRPSSLREAGTAFVRFLSPEPVEDYLNNTETLRVITHLHWVAAFRPLVKAAAGMPIGFLVMFLLKTFAPGIWWLELIVMLSMLHSPVMIAYYVLLWRSDRIVVTSQRMVRVSGVFTNKVEEVKLRRVTELDFFQSFPGRILNYGTFLLQTGGNTTNEVAREDEIPFVPYPKMMFQEMQPGD